MTLTMPEDLRSALSELGFDFPDSDEDKLNEMGQAWLGFAGTLRSLLTEAEKHASAVWTGNKGEAITAFQNSWSGPQAPLANLRDAADAAAAIGAAFAIAAHAVTVLKMAVIAEVGAFVRTCAMAARAARTGWGAVAAVAIIIGARILAQNAIEAAFEVAVKALEDG